eukprot:7168706-Prorocentrum_lima.AAC.1
MNPSMCVSGTYSVHVAIKGKPSKHDGTKSTSSVLSAQGTRSTGSSCMNATDAKRSCASSARVSMLSWMLPREPDPVRAWRM